MPRRFAPSATPWSGAREESPYLDLPSFQTVADTAGITERALAVWLTNPLPNLIALA